MTALFLDQFSELGGAQFCLIDLMAGLARQGWQIHLAAPGYGPLMARARACRAETHYLPVASYSLGRKHLLDRARFALSLRPLALAIRELVRDVGPDLLYVNGPRLMPAVACARTGLPAIFHSHNFLTTGAGRRMVAWAIARCGATVIAASRFTAGQWREAQVVYSGVGEPQAEKPERVSRAAPRIGMVGRFAPQKRQREFVEAARQLSRDVPDWRFVLCGDALFGDPAAERYRDQVLRRAPPSLRWLGWRDDVGQTLARLDLLVLPSADEGGFPRVILEAFAARVPVLALASGAIPEVMVDGRNGFLLSSPEPPDIARRVAELMTRNDRLVPVACEAYRLWRDRFTASRYVADISAVIDACQIRRSMTKAE